jgi:antitoxin (DNA-binding transcriptional repressor) of toxin-antitoxin stability system
VRTIAIAALKAHLSAEIKKAAAGERIVVVDHRRPVALLAPLPTGLTLTRKAKARYRYRDLPPLVSRDPLEALREERADRW